MMDIVTLSFCREMDKISLCAKYYCYIWSWTKEVLLIYYLPASQ